jgi:hypothetical protein
MSILYSITHQYNRIIIVIQSVSTGTLPMPEHQQIQQSKKPDTISQKQETPIKQIHLSNPMAIIQRVKINPKSLTHADVMQLQRTIGNRAVGSLLSEIGLIPSTAKPVQRQEIHEEEETCPSCVQRQEIPEEEEPLQGKFENSRQVTYSSCSVDSLIQRQEIPEEEEPLQGKFESIQRQEISEEKEPLQTKRENNTGMPDNLKAGVESLSGIDMSDVRVHYNSGKPADVGALAYAQGTDIHVAPGQEKHLPHEAWHVVQQAQGRVRPTILMKDRVPVNDEEELEHESDVMGRKALQQYEQVEKPKEDKSQSVANELSQKQSSGESTFQFVDNRPETVMQRKLRDIANNSLPVQRNHALQEMINKSSQLKKSAHLQAKANYYASHQKRSVQRTVNPSPVRGGANAPLQFQMGVIQAVFDLDLLEKDNNPTFTELMNRAGPGWPQVKKNRLAPLAASPCTAVEVLNLIISQNFTHDNFKKLANALTACGSAANYYAVYAHEQNLDNIPPLVALANSGDEAVQLLNRVGLLNFKQLLTVYKKAEYNPVEVVDAYQVRDKWARDERYIIYHFEKHVKNNGLTHTIAQYTQHAIAIFNTPVPPAVRTRTQTGDGIKVRVGAQGGSFRDNDNKILTAWYQED